MSNTPDLFETIRKINSNPLISQRNLAKELGFSLGKLNYCIKELNKKGLIKVHNFSRKADKLKYFKKYILTSKGVKYRLHLTIKYMRKKIKEYDQLKREIKNTQEKKL